MTKSITVSLDWEQYDRVVDEANIAQATSLAQEVKMLMDIKSAEEYQTQDLEDNLRYLNAYFTIIRYTHRTEDAEKIITQISSIYNNEVEDENRNQN